MKPLFSLFILFLIFSCTDDISITDSNKESKLTELKNRYDPLGKAHNNGLEYVYNKVHSHLIRNNISLKQMQNLEIKDLLKTSINEFVKTKTDIVVSDIISNTVDDFRIYYDDYDRTQTPFEHQIDLGNISAYEENILKKIDEIVTSSSSLDIKIQNIESYYDLVNLDNNIPAERKHLFYAAVSINSNSVKYWDVNFHKWNDLGVAPGHASLRGGCFSGGEVVKNDVAYGVGGGAAGAIVGGSVSFGILTLPGWAAGALGGAIGGSAGNAILQGLDCIWPEN